MKQLTVPFLPLGEEAGVLYLQSMFTDTGSGVWLSSPANLVIID